MSESEKHDSLVAILNKMVLGTKEISASDQARAFVHIGVCGKCQKMYKKLLKMHSSPPS